jgi:leucyl aminopeptidase
MANTHTQSSILMMKAPDFKVNAAAATTTCIIPVFENSDYQSHLSEVAAKIGFSSWAYFEGFKGKANESFLWVSDEGTKVYFLGLGNKQHVSGVCKAFRSFFYNKKEVFRGEISIWLWPENLELSAGEISNGIFLAQYQLGAQKEKNGGSTWFDENPGLNFEAFNEQIENVKSTVLKGYLLAKTQTKIMAWVDSPANFKTPQQLAEAIKASGRAEGFSVKVMDAHQCGAIGLKALLAVGKGSVENPPLFVLMEYKAAEAKKTIGLVGKGVTFDTGGVSLKPGDNMNYMKSDMGGAAAVIGAIEMAAKLRLPIHLVAAVPLTENCVDSLAIKPGDVIGSYLGKTIEVINTDAEGRLILADALSYVKKNYELDSLIDLATLTGNCIQALGYAAAALLSNNDTLADSLSAAGQKTGEKVWRMPLWDDYKDMMRSDVADIKNLSTAPIAGAITAAKFLEEFIDGHPSWAHLDIAGVAFGDSEFGTMKSATGYGVKLLLEWLETQSQE